MCMKYFPVYGDTDNPMCYPLFIALFQSKSEGAEAKDRRQSLEASEWRDNSKAFQQLTDLRMALFFINIKEQKQKANKIMNKIIDRDQDMCHLNL